MQHQEHTFSLQQQLRLTTKQKNSFTSTTWLTVIYHQLCPLLASTMKHTEIAELKLYITDRHVK